MRELIRTAAAAMTVAAAALATLVAFVLVRRTDFVSHQQSAPAAGRRQYQHAHMFTYIEEIHSIPYRSHHYLGEWRSWMEQYVCVCMHFRSISETAYAVRQFFLLSVATLSGDWKETRRLKTPHCVHCRLSTSLISLHQSIYFLCGAQITHELVKFTLDARVRSVCSCIADSVSSNLNHSLLQIQTTTSSTTTIYV